MTLAAGTRLGPYEVVAPLGAGGMGEVCRARDTRLDRDVAIKMLPADFAASAQLRARFEREAKTISQLNHPNVCTLFDVGQHEGNDYLVMELIEGESLADRLLKGALPIDLVLRHGIEIASALDAAHRHGIIHRDLKPANVMLTKSGAKLLDFGLAKSGPLVTSAGVSLIGDSPTEHKPLTEQGTILGTFQYMAPEQLEGQDADARTDIFAFGALLYEMATGRRAFQGKNKTSLIAAIVSSNPQPVSEIAPLTPPALDHVIRKCLAKDADDRWQSIHDVADQLRWIAEAGSRAGEAAPVVARRKTKLRMAWALHAATALVAVAATFAVMYATRPVPRVFRSTLLPPDKTTFDANAGAMVLSPDGTRIAFATADASGTTMLWVRSLDALSAQPLAGTEGAQSPFWSPDSRFLGYFSNGKLRKIAAVGGPSQALCDVRGGRGGAWSRDGVIIFSPSPTDALYRVAAAGGMPTPLTHLDEKSGQTTHRYPSFLPDGKHFIFLSDSRPETPGTDDGFAIVGGSLDSKETKVIVASSAPARYASSGELLFLRDHTLVAQPFDAKSLTLSGEAVPVAENVVRTSRFESIFSISDNGLLAFQQGDSGELSQLAWVDREGRDLGTVGKPADYRGFEISHDEKRVATFIIDPQSQKSDVWILDIARGTSTRLTFDNAEDTWPVWSPDDRVVYFTSSRQGRGDIFRKASAGTGSDELVYKDGDVKIVCSVSRDGTRAVLQSFSSGKTGWDVLFLSLSDGKATPFLQTPFNERFPSLSPDGRWLAYSSTESGRGEVFVQALGSDGGKYQISTDGGYAPRWLRNGAELVFMTLDDKAMSVDIKSEPAFSASVPRMLFETKARSIFGIEWDATADGSRFLINRPLNERGAISVTLVQNWRAALGK